MLRAGRTPRELAESLGVRADAPQLAPPGPARSPRARRRRRRPRPGERVPAYLGGEGQHPCLLCGCRLLGVSRSSDYDWDSPNATAAAKWRPSCEICTRNCVCALQVELVIYRPGMPPPSLGSTAWGLTPDFSSSRSRARDRPSRAAPAHVDLVRLALLMEQVEKLALGDLRHVPFALTADWLLRDGRWLDHS
jgi:hypothetical protein